MGPRASKVEAAPPSPRVSPPPSPPPSSPAISDVTKEEGQLIKSLRERGVSTAFFAESWRKYSDGPYEARIAVPKARTFLKEIAAELDVQVAEETYDSIINSCKNTNGRFRFGDFVLLFRRFAQENRIALTATLDAELPKNYTLSADDESFLPAKSPASLASLFRCNPPTYFSLLPRDLWLSVTQLLTEGLIENTKRIDSDWTYADVPNRLTQGTFILTPERFIFSAETAYYPPSAVLIALDLLPGPATTHREIWMSERISASSPLLVQVGEDLVAAASWGEISLFKPPDKLAHFKIPLPERSNNAPLVLAVAGRCIFSVQSVAQKKGIVDGEAKHALILVSQNQKVDKWTAETLFYTSRPVRVVAADLIEHGVVCAVVTDTSVQLYFSRQKVTKNVIIPPLRPFTGISAKLNPDSFLFRNRFYIVHDCMILAYDLSDLQKPVRSFEIFEETRAVGIANQSRQGRTFLIHLDGDRFVCAHGDRSSTCLISLDPETFKVYSRGYVPVILQPFAGLEQVSRLAFTETALFYTAPSRSADGSNQHIISRLIATKEIPDIRTRWEAAPMQPFDIPIAGDVTVRVNLAELLLIYQQSWFVISDSFMLVATKRLLTMYRPLRAAAPAPLASPKAAT